MCSDVVPGLARVVSVLSCSPSQQSESFVGGPCVRGMNLLGICKVLAHTTAKPVLCLYNRDRVLAIVVFFLEKMSLKWRPKGIEL